MKNEALIKLYETMLLVLTIYREYLDARFKNSLKYILTISEDDEDLEKIRSLEQMGFLNFEGIMKNSVYVYCLSETGISFGTHVLGALGTIGNRFQELKQSIILFKESGKKSIVLAQAIKTMQNYIIKNEEETDEYFLNKEPWHL